MLMLETFFTDQVFRACERRPVACSHARGLRAGCEYASHVAGAESPDR